MPEIFEMIDPIQNYSWGSHTVLASLQGRPSPSEQPEAELWIGSHSGGSSQLVLEDGARSLDELLREDPERFVRGGAQAVSEDGSLPFLLKILAIDAPLSIQVHPSIEQAREGFEREESQGIPLGAPHRSYKDRSDKPETVVALSRLQILTGIRDRAELALLAESLDQQWLRDALESPEPVLRTVLGLSEDRAAEALAELESAARRLPPGDELGALLGYVSESHPGDRGLLVAACMNHFVLEPGESMFTPAGQVHAYLQGTAVEIMACSDNVLRAGLTPKHVDVPELLRVVTDDQDPGEPQESSAGADGLRRIPLWDDRLSLVSGKATPARDLSLEPGVCTVLCVEGTITLSVPGTDPVRITAGSSAWVRADDARITVSGQGELYAVGLSA
ncbi:mannose-6-phosphate isomerase, class I [Kocuria palustris]|uniref:mannose-6-phosphate isomerase, class I n=1 Tax=Kocuria palustris TaxID=71999 RepID=UPI0011A42836|nr:mannose-6-phosphate isomerase, class I [Kocuria palustris]